MYQCDGACLDRLARKCRLWPWNPSTPWGNSPSKISQKGLISETDACCLHNAIKLSFAAAEADDSLRGAPRLDEVRSNHEATSICGLSCLWTPCPIRIAVGIHLFSGLPRIPEDYAWTTLEVSAKSLEADNTCLRRGRHPPAEFFGGVLYIQPVHCQIICTRGNCPECTVLFRR